MKLRWKVFVVAMLLLAGLIVAAQSVYPTSVTILDPEQTWNGYTVLSPLGVQAAVVIDMNGRVVKQWDNIVNSAGGPVRVFPNGVVMAANGNGAPHQESSELTQRSFEGETLWRFDRSEQIMSRDGSLIWSARQHHDWQREDFPVGYFSPGVQPAADISKVLILTHRNHTLPEVAGVSLEDDRLIEVSKSGDVLWEWIAGEHIGEFGFSDAARKVIKDAPDFNAARGSFDWFHVNSATYLGPNHWFDEGDKRFAPTNVMISSRQASVLAIVGREGKIVWRLGPDFSESKELKAIKQIIGQHHAHLIPKGLPGAGNLLVFDNGGASGYGFPNPNAPDGNNSFARATSRVLEINPVTLQLVWSYANPRFYSSNISGAQRLPNGNTLITEGASGRLLEVTKEGKTVWEYIYPVFTGNQQPPTNSVYRAYRIPYDWIPQITRPRERAIVPPSNASFRVQ